MAAYPLLVHEDLAERVEPGSVEAHGPVGPAAGPAGGDDAAEREHDVGVVGGIEDDT